MFKEKSESALELSGSQALIFASVRTSLGSMIIETALGFLLLGVKAEL